MATAVLAVVVGVVGVEVGEGWRPKAAAGGNISDFWHECL